MSEYNSLFDKTEGMDLRRFINTILKRWKLILIAMLIGGLLTTVIYLVVKPTYTAMAQISVSPGAIIGTSAPINLIQNDEIRSKVAEELGITKDDLPDMTFLPEKTDKTIIQISATSQNSNLAVNAVNVWADVSIKWMKDLVFEMGVEVQNAKISLDETSNKLTLYLLENNLSYLTWSDLVIITGAGDASNIAIMENSREMPTLTLKQRNDITKLIRDKNLAQWYYNDIAKTSLTISTFSQQKMLNLNKATDAEENFAFGGILLIPAGILLGFFVAVVWILVDDWWKSSLPLEKAD